VLWCLQGLDSIIDEDREPESLVIVEHQSGGHACDRDAFLARPLVLSDSGVTLLAELTAPYYHKGSGHFHSCTDRDIEEYRQSLRAAQLTADKVFAADYRLIEGVYPLDPTPENLAILTGDHSIPSEVIKRIMSADDARKHLVIIVLADNSD
jgi:hypothetical protein